MHRSRIPYGRPGRVMSLVAAAAMAAVPLAVPSTATAAAPKNTEFSIGVGNHPSIVVAANGTAHVAWVHKSGDEDDQVQYCRVPRGTRKCTGLITFDAPNATGEQPQVLMPTPTTVDIVYYTYNFPNEPSDRTFLVSSTNGGVSFGPAVLIGTHNEGGGAALGPNNTIYTVNSYSTYGINVQRDNLDGSAVPAEGAQANFTDEYGGTLAVLPNGGVLLSHWDETDGTGTLNVSQFSGTGDPNATASWSPVFSGPGETSILGNGPKGPYLFSSANAADDPPFQIRKWTGATFGPAVNITPSGQAAEQPTFWEDASGRLNLAYWIGDQAYYKASDLKGWTVREALANGGYNQRGATAADGGGFVVYDNQDDTGKIVMVPIPVRRTITAAKAHGQISGRVRPGYAHQPVQLQIKLNGKWVLLKTTSTKANGSYTFAIPDKKGTYRTVAVVLEGYFAATSGNVVVS